MATQPNTEPLVTRLTRMTKTAADLRRRQVEHEEARDHLQRVEDRLTAHHHHRDPDSGSKA